MIIAIRNKKYGKFTFNTLIEAEQYENEPEKVEKLQKNLKTFENLFTKNKDCLEPITTKEIGSFEELLI